MTFRAYMSWQVDQLAVSCFKSGNLEQQFAYKGTERFAKGGIAVGSGTGTRATGRTRAGTSKSRPLAGPYATGI